MEGPSMGSLNMRLMPKMAKDQQLLDSNENMPKCLFAKAVNHFFGVIWGVSVMHICVWGKCLGECL